MPWPILTLTPSPAGCPCPPSHSLPGSKAPTYAVFAEPSPATMMGTSPIENRHSAISIRQSAFANRQPATGNRNCTPLYHQAIISPDIEKSRKIDHGWRLQNVAAGRPAERGESARSGWARKIPGTLGSALAWPPRSIRLRRHQDYTSLTGPSSLQHSSLLREMTSPDGSFISRALPSSAHSVVPFWGIKR